MERIRPEEHDKPWGKEIWIYNDDRYGGKILMIKGNYRTSKHYHEKKKETFYILEGKLKIEIPNGKDIIIDATDEKKAITIFPEEIHRLYAIENDVKIIEFSTSESDDVVRVDDDYGRSTKD